MSNYEEIKKLVESSRKMFSNINESTKNDIRLKYGMLTEQPVEKEQKVVIGQEKKDSEDIGTPRDKQKAFRIQGNILVLHGKEESDLHFRQLSYLALKHHSFIQLAIGSHNLQDHAFVEALRKLRFPEAPIIEHQCLHLVYAAYAHQQNNSLVPASKNPFRHYILLHLIAYP
jgi:hypothetical protein